MTNPTIFQFFHWYYPADGSLWRRVSEQAEHLCNLGITHVWLPPAYKSANGPGGVGYEVYDHFDLGEFDQKGSVRTKYGTREEYLECIEKLHKYQIKVLADIVFNHKQGADETEKVTVQKVKVDHRIEFIGEPEEMDIYTLYTFPNRNKKYSEFHWDWQTFTGIDQRTDDGYSIYKIHNQYGHDWEDLLEEEMGNFDYLMGADIEFRNPHVREELKYWGKWYYETTGIDGFRLDAVKHIAPGFFIEWLDYMRTEVNPDFFCIAEYWSREAGVLKNYLDRMEGRTQLFDVPLHYNFYEASMQGKQFDMKKIFDGSLVQTNPELAITFVDNHDTQPFQALESPVDYWFKPLAYSITLLRLQGMPCLFYPSYFGAKYKEMDHEVELVPVPYINNMVLARKMLAFGGQKDYFDHGNVVGWTREGIDEKEFSGLAVLMSTGDEGFKRMEVGAQHANKEFIDITLNFDQVITCNEHGQAEFLTKAGSVSIWIRKEARRWFP